MGGYCRVNPLLWLAVPVGSRVLAAVIVWRGNRAAPTMTSDWRGSAHALRGDDGTDD
jgi:hypothetical protein